MPAPINQLATASSWWDHAFSVAETTPNFRQIVAAFSVLGRTMISLICDGRDLLADENSGTCIDDTHFGRS